MFRYQSNPSRGWALTRNNCTRKISFSSVFLHPSAFNSFSIYPRPWLSLSFLLSPIFCHFFSPCCPVFLFCPLSLLCFHIIPSSSFVVVCHSFLLCIVSLQPPLLAAFISPPLHASQEMPQSSFRYLLVKRTGRNRRGEEIMLLLF